MFLTSEEIENVVSNLPLRIVDAHALVYQKADKQVDTATISALVLEFSSSNSIKIECHKDGESIALSKNVELEEVSMEDWGNFIVVNAKKLDGLADVIGYDLSQILTIHDQFDRVVGLQLRKGNQLETNILNSGDNIIITSALPGDLSCA
jgi:hypothetical protein